MGACRSVVPSGAGATDACMPWRGLSVTPLRSPTDCAGFTDLRGTEPDIPLTPRCHGPLRAPGNPPSASQKQAAPGRCDDCAMDCYAACCSCCIASGLCGCPPRSKYPRQGLRMTCPICRNCVQTVPEFEVGAASTQTNSTYEATKTSKYESQKQ